MTSTELPWTVAARKVRPYALAVSAASTVVAWAIVVHHDDAGRSLETGPGVLVGWAALAAALLLWGGWWGRSDRWMRAGLLASAGAFAARAAWILLGEPTSVAGWLSVAWCIASSGAWLLERGARD
jgi:hypothetical protein